ncbi:sulfurtransferase TusA family protein [Thalassobacillus hwangdonensis]|uniref:Sulfurtransferase TusA family protein n=1 Tax=Thalassobacillus hwangdonensis TaxID=546108 RepID=A0ABW3KYJ5_9BACI
MKVNEVLDAKGLACPMPIVKTKKAMTTMEPGHVLEVLATDRGSIADLEAWAGNMGHQYLGYKEDGDVLKHYLRKNSDGEDKPEKKHEQTITNEDLKKLDTEAITLVDVREPAEYEFGHIPNAVSVPLGELEGNLDKIDKDKDVYVVCRTGSRSDLAAQKLSEKGWNVYNVVPGMKEWDGEVTK